MTLQLVSSFQVNGLFFIFIILFLEGLNLTGTPALVILPAIGVFASTTQTTLLSVLCISIVGSFTGNLLYYSVASYFGSSLYSFFYNKLPFTQKSLLKARSISEQYGPIACLVARLIPAARTFVSLMAGIFKVPIHYFMIYSFIGIAIWNTCFILIGYFFGSL